MKSGEYQSPDFFCFFSYARPGYAEACYFLYPRRNLSP